MSYYHVWVRSEQYRGNEPLTYKHDQALAPGTLVMVPLRQQIVPGFVTARVAKPKFATKAIADVMPMPPLPPASLKLASWLQHYYPSPIGVIAGQFLPQSLRRTLDRALNADTVPVNPPAPPLTMPQKSALEAIGQPDTYLLHGRTGSGKTRLYIELAIRAISQGKSALILCPEIGLTSQLALHFRNVFGDRVIILHSQLTQREREIAWLTILQSESPLIVIGARSALFSPLREIGLIVVDESHDQAYKQEQPPYYQAVRVASHLRALHKAILVLGSATPLVTDYFLAEQKGKAILRLDALAVPQPYERRATIVDLKDRSAFKSAGHLSSALIQAITGSLERHEQSLLYINRRGTARVTLCDVCGWQALCSHCDLPLTYHGDSFNLRCHLCGYHQSPPSCCPSCGNPSIAFHSYGTKAIVEEAQRIFPEARIMRLDTDSLKAERLENQYHTIMDGEVDILVGTQLLTKGLDLPRLSTLGILLADSSLYLPDYTAGERTYQLLTQVLGRVGRGHVEGHAIIQTYQPKSPLIQAALADDWPSFYTQEIAERKAYFYPPFCHMLKLTTQRSTPANAEKAAVKLKTAVLQDVRGVEIDGPAPAFHEKAGAKYKWQLVIKSRERQRLLETVSLLPAGWSYDLDPQDLL